MRFKNRILTVLGCAALLSMSVPAFSEPLPKPRPSIAKHAKQAQAHRASRLVSRRLTQPLKPPTFGWPVLVKEARKYIGTNPTDRNRLWCATFMNMVLANTGYSGTNSDAAKSFAQYGRRIAEPKVGAIAVLTRGKRGGHVGVVSGVDGKGNPIIISGNHGRKVGEAIYPRSRVIAYVMPSERRSGSVEFAARASARGTANRSTPETGIESPIAELLAAIAAERNRPEPPRQAAQPAPAPERRLIVQQAAETAPVSRRDLPLDPGLAEFLGIKDRS